MGKIYGRKKDAGINGAMAKWYDKNTRESRLILMEESANEISSLTPATGKILEVAPGPGYLSIILAKQGYDVTGIDISADFIEICKKNAAEEGVKISFLQGSASDIKFEDSTFNSIICSAAFKNFKEPVKALAEMYRVIKPGGVALIIDMNPNSTNLAQDEELKKLGSVGFDRLFLKFAYRTFLKVGAYSEQDITEMIKQAGISKFNIKSKGVSLYVYLYKPE